MRMILPDQTGHNIQLTCIFGEKPSEHRKTGCARRPYHPVLLFKQWQRSTADRHVEASCIVRRGVGVSTSPAWMFHLLWIKPCGLCHSIWRAVSTNTVCISFPARQSHPSQRMAGYWSQTLPSTLPKETMDIRSPSLLLRQPLAAISWFSCPIHLQEHRERAGDRPRDANSWLKTSWKRQT